MPVEISVGPPVITINQDNIFMVTDPNGEIDPESEQGIFAYDTRYVSKLKMLANGKPWTRLSSSAVNYFAARLYLTNQALPVEEGEIPAGTIGLTISRAVFDGIHQDVDVTNYGLKQVTFNLEFEIHTDFADIFEVKDHKFIHRGRMDMWRDHEHKDTLVTYENRDFKRTMVIHGLHEDSPTRVVNGFITFEITLHPGSSWHGCHHFSFHNGEDIRRPGYTCFFTRGETDIDRMQREWQEQATKLITSNEDLSRAYRQSVEDMGALRLHRYDIASDIWLPAAGVPWFVTVFGRDSLIVSLQNMLVDPGFARGALQTLAQFQATEVDDWRDAQPGKILHEIRFGELAHFKKIPHTPY